MVTPNAIAEELERRLSAWRELLRQGGPKAVEARALRDLGIYGGAQGIWVDKARTGSLADNGSGVTVAVLHTGSSYQDDLATDCILYHYPSTDRPASRDLGEVDATKNAKHLGLPVFVVTYPAPNSRHRDVNLAWVWDWDDQACHFLFSFGEEAPQHNLDVGDNAPFELTEPKAPSKRLATAREGQQRFKFVVFKRYGPRCAFCDIGVRDVLDAAHLRAKRHDGSDDPRNGLVLCALHHRAFDAGLVEVHPETLELHMRDEGPSRETLRITRESIKHLTKPPHPVALRWCWKRRDLS